MTARHPYDNGSGWKRRQNEVVMCIDDALFRPFLTIGKKYTIEEAITQNGVEELILVDDTGTCSTFRASRFLPTKS